MFGIERVDDADPFIPSETFDDRFIAFPIPPRRGAEDCGYNIFGPVYHNWIDQM